MIEAALLLFALAVPLPRVFTPGAPVEGYERMPPPSIQMRMNQASATTVPWIDSNAWRFRRGVRKALYDNLPAGTATVAAAEAHAWGIDAILKPAPEDADSLQAFLEFLKQIGSTDLPARANIAIVDDGSAEMPEVLNLLSRRNLLFKVVKASDPRADLNIRIGTKQYPRDSVLNPNDFAARVREQLTDDKRVVRLFGTYTVLVNLTGDNRHSRLHLVNYSRRPVKDVRVRVLGSYRKVRLSEANDAKQTAADVIVVNGATEFTVPALKTYAVVDLEN
ncbi:MAG: hypothetical protein SGI92_22480 [Bryobacteraceae bacterium]|nr:hypothetical protein [Bryobacteraceae bacterium]